MGDQEVGQAQVHHRDTAATVDPGYSPLEGQGHIDQPSQSVTTGRHLSQEEAGGIQQDERTYFPSSPVRETDDGGVSAVGDDEPHEVEYAENGSQEQESEESAEMSA